MHNTIHCIYDHNTNQLVPQLVVLCDPCMTMDCLVSPISVIIIIISNVMDMSKSISNIGCVLCSPVQSVTYNC